MGPQLSLFGIVKTGVNRVLSPFGVQLVRNPKPVVGGTETVSGSFPPYGDLHIIGRRENRFIQDGYQSRAEPQYFDDTITPDGWQEEVYRFAREIFDSGSLNSVLDIGCGSGRKLMKYFPDRQTIGLDVEKTCAALRRRYPGRQWQVADFRATAVPAADLVIASDVIEHVADPDEMLEYILRIDPQYLIVSTPDRNLLRYGTHKGPPSNPTHLREWTMAEFHAYLSERWEILEHFISCAPQCTQCVLAKPKKSQATALAAESISS